jgi:hypothetical protein
MLKFAIENLLTAEFAMAQMAEMGDQLSRRRGLREAGVDETRRCLQGVDESIHMLPDLAEQYGAESAGARLVQREAERRELLAKLEQMEAREEAQRQAAPSDGVQAMLAELRETLAGADARAQQALLKKLVVGVKLRKEQGEVFQWVARKRGLNRFGELMQQGSFFRWKEHLLIGGDLHFQPAQRLPVRWELDAHDEGFLASWVRLPQRQRLTLNTERPAFSQQLLCRPQGFSYCLHHLRVRYGVTHSEIQVLGEPIVCEVELA